MAIDKIQDYKSMLGQSLLVCGMERIWSDNRRKLNQSNEVIITNEVISFIDLLKQNFIDQNPEWDGLLIVRSALSTVNNDEGGRERIGIVFYSFESRSWPFEGRALIDGIDQYGRHGVSDRRNL